MHFFEVPPEIHVPIFAHHGRPFQQLVDRKSQLKTQYTVSRNRNIVHGASYHQPCCEALFSPRGTGNQAIPNIELMGVLKFFLWHAFGRYAWYYYSSRDIPVLIRISSLKHFLESTNIIAQKTRLPERSGMILERKKPE